MKDISNVYAKILNITQGLRMISVFGPPIIYVKLCHLVTHNFLKYIIILQEKYYCSATTTTKPLLPNKLRQARGETQKNLTTNSWF
jgi:hypothetical protein